MKTYARIQVDHVAELLSTDGGISTMFHPSLIWVDVTDFDPMPGHQWLAVFEDGEWKFSEPLPDPRQ